jgi:transposase
LNERYKNDETGRSAYDPKVLLKIVLLAYARGIFTSRKQEKLEDKVRQLLTAQIEAARLSMKNARDKPSDYGRRQRG